MPCTPIAVSAWRTSSSLKGFITATTSFMEVASWRVRSLSCRFYRQYGQKISEICRDGEGYPQIYPFPGHCRARILLPRLLPAPPQRAFLRDGGYEGAIGLEDHAARQPAAGAG